LHHFVVRSKRSTKHGHATRTTICRFVELAIAAAPEWPAGLNGRPETQN
jgi:hypothetical protein